ncbi:MAG: hypothetical protein ABEJ27_08220 [Halodesulfurarchaeum sp.]
MPNETLALTVEVEGQYEEIDLPSTLVDLFREEESETDAEIIADVLVMAFAERAHAFIHHDEGGDDEQLQAIESAMMERFEERFGMTYEEATGHSH